MPTFASATPRRAPTWRLAAAPAPATMARPRSRPASALAADPRRAHNSLLPATVTTLDDLFARGLRIEALGGFSTASRRPARSTPRTMPSSERRISPSGRRSSGRRHSATSTRSSSTSRRCGTAAAARSPRPGSGCRSSTSRTSPSCAAPATPCGRRTAVEELDFELEVGAIVDTPAYNLPERARSGGHRRLPDRQRLVRARPPARRVHGPARTGEGQGLRASIGPWIVTPDELADRWVAGATAPDLSMTATVTAADGTVTEVSRGSWSIAGYSFGQMARARARDVHVAPGRPPRQRHGRRPAACSRSRTRRSAALAFEPGDQVTLETQRIVTSQARSTRAAERIAEAAPYSVTRPAGSRDTEVPMREG